MFDPCASECSKASVEGSGSVAVSGNFERLDVDFAFRLLQNGIPLLIHHPSNAPGEPWTKRSWLTATMKVTWLKGLTKLGLQNLGPFFWKLRQVPSGDWSFSSSSSHLDGVHHHLYGHFSCHYFHASAAILCEILSRQQCSCWLFVCFLVSIPKTIALNPDVIRLQDFN